MSSSTVATAQMSPLPPGRLTDLAAAHRKMVFVWCDLDGLHYGRTPDRAPGATHIWGWTQGTALLARLEQSAVVAGTLLRRSTTGDVVRVTVRPLVKWRQDTDDPMHHIGELPGELHALRLVTLEVPGPLELLADTSWNGG